MTVPDTRPKAREAAADLLVLGRAEEFCSWLIETTAKWPKSARFTLTQRIENAALDVVEDLVIARYSKPERRSRLEAVNLRIERMRHLLRLAKLARVCPQQAFETSARSLDEIGRMAHGWRTRPLESGAT